MQYLGNRTEAKHETHFISCTPCTHGLKVISYNIFSVLVVCACAVLPLSHVVRCRLFFPTCGISGTFSIWMCNKLMFKLCRCAW